eukprot:TRINITY_DN46779_c0_g1_i1.p1 TRINITY_DN46779_c0_g1~~TRINITY_DN46779_c0_g1_i1.p1  ORF type:complete len:540 (+),score=134.24 TRINITY_DN46779_c0_g1_i1:111-1730(+)
MAESMLEQKSTDPGVAEKAADETPAGPSIADEEVNETSKGPGMADSAVEEASKEEPVAASEGEAVSGSATASSRREQLLARLQAAAREVTDLEQLEQAIDTFERYQSEKLARRPALVRQIQFYFSDANLRKDKYMREKIEASPEGYVPIDVLLPFKRLKLMGCTTASEIAAAIEGAPESCGVEVSLRRDALRRAGGVPLPSIVASGADQDRRTVQLRGFPECDESVTIEAVIELFSGTGKVSFVRLLRNANGIPQQDGQKPFLGVAEVELESEEAAAAIVNSEKPLGWDGEALQARLMSDVRREAREERARKRPAEDKGKSGSRGSGEENEAKRQRQDPASEIAASIGRGLSLRFDKIEKTVSWKDIRIGLKPYGSVAFVDYVQGSDGELGHAFVRMRSEDGVNAILSCAEEDEGCLSIQCWPSGNPPEEEDHVAETPKAESLEEDGASKDKPAAKRKAFGDDDGVQQSVTIRLPVTKISGDAEEALVLKDATHQVRKGESKGKGGKRSKGKDGKGGKKGKDGKSKKGGKGKSGKRDED